MKENKHDDERIAALLAGRLEGPEREELLAHLLANDEDYQVFADTAAILREAEEEDAAQAPAPAPHPEPIAVQPAVREAVRPTVPPTMKPRGWSRRVMTPLVLAGLMLIGFAVSRGRSGGMNDPVQWAASLERAGQPLPDDWYGWDGGNRGPGDAKRNARSAQAGGLLVQLAVAIEVGDSASTHAVANSMISRLGIIESPNHPVVQIRDQAGDSVAVLRQRLGEANERLTELSNRDFLAVGAWTETARLAANDRDAEFFRSRRTRVMLNRAERVAGDIKEERERTSVQQAIEQIRTLIAADGPMQWETLQLRLDELMNGIS